MKQITKKKQLSTYGQKKSFQGKEKMGEFTTSRSALKEILKVIFQVERQ